MAETNVGATILTLKAAQDYLQSYADLKIAESTLRTKKMVALQNGVTEEDLKAARDLIDRAATR